MHLRFSYLRFFLILELRQNFMFAVYFWHSCLQSYVLLIFFPFLILFYYNNDTLGLICSFLHLSNDLIFTHLVHLFRWDTIYHKLSKGAKESTENPLRKGAVCRIFAKSPYYLFIFIDSPSNPINGNKQKKPRNLLCYWHSWKHFFGLVCCNSLQEKCSNRFWEIIFTIFHSKPHFC